MLFIAGEAQEALLRGGCNKWQHRTCNSGVSRETYRDAVRFGGKISLGNANPVPLRVLFYLTSRVRGTKVTKIKKGKG